MKQFYLIVLAFLFAQSLFAQKQTIYEGLDYEIKYPTDWFLSDKADLDVEEGKDIFPELILYAPQYASEGANIIENINLIIGDSDGFSLDDIAALVEFTIKGSDKDTRMISSRKRRKKGQQYHEFVYKEKNNAGAMVIYEQHIYVNEHNMYLLTFGCEEENYEKYKETGQEVMRSFKLTKNR